MHSLVAGLLVKGIEVEWKGCLSISLKYEYCYFFFLENTNHWKYCRLFVKIGEKCGE